MPFYEGSRFALSLAASGATPYFLWLRDGASLSIKCSFTVADAVGTLEVQNAQGNPIAFLDEDEASQTSLAITSALNGLGHEFVLKGEPRGKYRLAYARTSGGALDSVSIDWE